jgi:hypothetical protein
MRRFALIATALLLAVPAWADDLERTFDLDRPASGITRIVLEVGVGDVEIVGDESDRITAHVEVSASKGWRGSARARRELEAMQLEAEVKGEALHLRMSEHGEGDRHFGENWTLHVPAGTALELELGVGDLRVLDLAGTIEIEVGVGDVRVEGEHAAFGEIEGQCGVGDVSLRTPKGRTEGSGFIAHTLEARGPGKSAIDVEVGVGDVDIRLR